MDHYRAGVIQPMLRACAVGILAIVSSLFLVSAEGKEAACPRERWAERVYKHSVEALNPE